MKLETRLQRDPYPGGYSMIELVVVVGLIVVMAAIAIPNIAGYTRNYRVRGATQAIAGELQTARNKAITRNTNFGVAFAIVDANSYRFTILDDDNLPAPAVPGRGLAPLRDLPQGVLFAPPANTPVFGMGFDRLGRRCVLGSVGCAVVQDAATMCTGVVPLDTRCTDRPVGSFLDLNPADGSVTIRVRDEQTGVTRTVSIAPGGRVMNQR
jgi:type II secretory pathway pseudopilin PulG